MHHPGGCPVHRYGFCLEPPDWRRSRVYAGTGFGQRSDHAGPVCTHRSVPGFRGIVVDRSISSACELGHRIHRDSAGAGSLLRTWLIRKRGRGWFETVLLPRLAPVTITALLTTLVLIFAFQADNL